MTVKQHLKVIAAITLAVAGFALGVSTFDVTAISPEYLEEVDSPYQTIFIKETNGIRWMHAGSLKDQTSAMDVNEPNRHVMKYTEMMMLASGYVKAPQRLLVVGLGGGTVTKSLRFLYPEAEIVNVEFDPEVVSMARKYFHYAEDENMRLVVQDARRWLRNTDEKFDIIFLDAYHGDYIPFHLMTVEFLRLVRARLTTAGVVCANTWLGQDFEYRESATYAEVFGGFHQFATGRRSNRIIIAGAGALPHSDDVLHQLKALEEARKPEHMDMSALFEETFDPDPLWRDGAETLTDDFAPVNLLRGGS